MFCCCRLSNVHYNGFGITFGENFGAAEPDGLRSKTFEGEAAS